MGKSLFADNPNFIDGFLLGTTWKIMSLYVTPIIIGSAYNFGTPVKAHTHIINVNFIVAELEGFIIS